MAANTVGFPNTTGAKETAAGRPLLEIRNLTAGYADKTVLSEVSLSLMPGEIIGIAGESGSGKSTLLKSILRYPGSQVEILSGRIVFDGREISSFTEKELRQISGKAVCMIFQKPEASMDPVMKVRNQFIESVRAHDAGKSKEEIRAMAVDWLKRLRFRDSERVLASYPFELSGGMNQRVAIAMAMMMEPQLILADEPTSALDVTVQAEVIRSMRELSRETGASVLIVSHNIHVLRVISDRIGIMYKGRLVEFGVTGDVLENPQHEYTRHLLAAVPAIPGGNRS